MLWRPQSSRKTLPDVEEAAMSASKLAVIITKICEAILFIVPLIAVVVVGIVHQHGNNKKTP